jgi:hypothetical protein
MGDVVVVLEVGLVLVTESNSPLVRQDEGEREECLQEMRGCTAAFLRERLVILEGRPECEPRGDVPADGGEFLDTPLVVA